MQPLLLLKQTLEAPYDPGPLRIDGPNVEFTAADQFFSRLGPAKSAVARRLTIGVTAGDEVLETSFERGKKGDAPLVITEMSGSGEGGPFEITPQMKQEELLDQVSDPWRRIYDRELKSDANLELRVRRNRCFLEIGLGAAAARGFFPTTSFVGSVERLIRGVIHVPGLRGNPERLYPVTAVGSTYPGQFQTYVASIIAQLDDGGTTINDLGNDLRGLGLTWRIRAVPVSDTQVEIQVGRTPLALQGGAWDLVSIADVGFGVSQVLPLLVALRVAQRGQLIFVEQPEIHLHPRAQIALGEIIGAAVARGVRVVVETHSDVLLLALQTLVAREKLKPEDVRFHWFSRDSEGFTEVSTADLDAAGSFGEWPEDFADVQLRARSDYLEWAEPKMRFEDG